jgi:hypothetical protein
LGEGAGAGREAVQNLCHSQLTTGR